MIYIVHTYADVRMMVSHMRILKCANCNANELIEKDGYFICAYCGSKFAIEASDRPQNAMGVSISEDIKRLLAKCRTDRKNARKYANLILDIDPNNKDALQYL